MIRERRAVLGVLLAILILALGLSYQSFQKGTRLEVPDARAGLAELRGAMEIARSGWVARMPTHAGPHDLDGILAAVRPWATFDRADGVRLYRFEEGRLVAP